MGRSLFGTDGVRGRANEMPMTAEIALKLGMAAGHMFRKGDHRHQVVVGKDTRLSGYMIESALTAGFTAVGMDVVLLGPVPTPAVANLTQSLRADLGVMISASHNPYYDNGIKLFGPDGFKLSDERESQIEHLIANADQVDLAKSDKLGRASRLGSSGERYIEAAKASLSRDIKLSGLRLVIDTAHGAAYKVAGRVLWELGAEIIEIGNAPNGTNINDACGSTAPEYAAKAVKDYRADAGITLDGDADRLILIDENGRIVDGDQILALIADDWLKTGRLKGGGIVATVMSNLGLSRFLGSKGLELVRTRVGDRYVVEAMREHGINLGGEQSGHLVMTDHATTGDGLLAALQVLSVVVRNQKPVSEVGHLFQPVPQKLVNIRYTAGSDPLDNAEVKSLLKDVEGTIEGKGRVLIRKSGTEPLIRVMVEADDAALLNDSMTQLCDAIKAVA